MPGEEALGGDPGAERNLFSLRAQSTRAQGKRPIADPEIGALESFSKRLIAKDPTAKGVYEDLKGAGCDGRTLCVFLTAAVHAALEDQQSLQGAIGKRRPAKTMWRFLL